MAPDQRSSALRVAIVGLGPKGLFGLERLLDHVPRTGPHVPIDIDVFEPHPVPGAGPVYDPAQPDYLRMNLAADRLSTWCGESRAAPDAERLSFMQWSARMADGAAPERFPPRAQVGRYLAEGLATMIRAAPPGVRITLRPFAVLAARRLGSAWRLRAADDALHDYDEVLLALGHRSAGDSWSPGGWSHSAPLIPAVFPVTRWLSRERVPAAATVAVRGFALTFIDAALALTQGRGGAFESAGHPYRLRYVPSAQDAGLILPFSRTGRPILAKPEPELAGGVPALELIGQAGRAEILALRETFDLRADLLPIVASAAAASLLAATARPVSGAELSRATRSAEQWLVGACRGRTPPAELDPAAELERSLAIGAGLHPPDLQWALGHAWQSLYPAIVTRLSGAGMPDRAWPAFHRLAAHLERLAFGPPAVNAAKLLALIAARRVDLTYVTGGQLATIGAQTSIRSTTAACPVDVVVDAVLPGPGVRQSDGGLLAQLVADGLAGVVSGQRGLDVTRDAACVGRDGRRTPGLSALGRPTEDSVIGNDTLSRTLHPHADRWARRVAARSIRRTPAAVLETASAP